MRNGLTHQPHDPSHIDFHFETFDRFSFSIFLGFDESSTKADIASGDVKVARLKRSSRLHDAFDVPTDNALVGAAHSNVALKRRATRENASVGGGDVGVGSQDGSYFSVEVSTDHLFVAGGLGVNIDQDVFRRVANFRNRAIARVERAINRRM